MKVKFDYLPGPVLGHKMRCQVLIDALESRGHQIVEIGQDWLIVDYPPDQFPSSTGERRLVMGIPPQVETDYSWNPLGEPGYPRTLYGGAYLIITPWIKKHLDTPKTRDLLVTCGGADPAGLSEKIMAILPQGDIVIGPNFNRTVEIPDGWWAYYGLAHLQMIAALARYETILCAWGGTTFEALALGAKVLTIAINDTYTTEAAQLGMEAVTLDTLDTIPARLAKLERNNYGVSADGVEKVVDFMEQVLND